MTWNWQKKDWPHFRYDKTVLDEYENLFLRKSGEFLGSHKHILEIEKNSLMISLISDEALKTSEIEGEYLNRESVQTSLRRAFGLQAGTQKTPLAEQGIANMLVDVYQSYAAPLTHQALFKWHENLTLGRKDLKNVGSYRTHPEPMQVVSGAIHNPKVHFEAPPSKQMTHEMNQFISWFNNGALPALTRSAITHLYFVCIHPFEDGNGRIGRALCEKSLSQSIGSPSLIALSTTIQAHRKKYYDLLEASNKGLEITDWILYFASNILEACDTSQALINFTIAKTKYYDIHKHHFNERQAKVIARLFREGPNGFKGGLSAENYLKITQTSRATATRDLTDLVKKNALTSTGQLKSTRYYLNLEK